MLFAKHFIGAALTLFFCGWTGRSIQASEHHPMRIVLDENGDHSVGACSAKEIATIQDHLSAESDRRQLQAVLGPNDRPCQDKCAGFPPGYCYMLFCYKKRRALKSKPIKLSQVDLHECLDDMKVANDAMNRLFRDRTISEDCKDLIAGSRGFSCFDEDGDE